MSYEFEFGTSLYLVNELFDYLGFCRYRSTARIPAVLQVCSESRSEASKHYRLSFGYTIDNKTTGAFTYFDPSVDVLYLDWKSFSENTPRFEYGDNFASMLFSSILLDINELSDVRSIAMCQVAVLMD